MTAALALAHAEPLEDRLAGEGLRFEEVFREHTPYVWRALRRLGVRAVDVEDVCQDVFWTVHRRLGSFEGRSSLRTWIYGVCVRKAGAYRDKLRRRPDEVSDGPEPSVPPHQIEDMERRQAIVLLDRVLDKLDDKKREVFVLFEIEGMPMAEVAEAVGCPLQTAYARLYAARERFDEAVRRTRAAGRDS